MSRQRQGYGSKNIDRTELGIRLRGLGEVRRRILIASLMRRRFSERHMSFKGKRIKWTKAERAVGERGRRCATSL
jgi:hypothetical protein